MEFITQKKKKSQDQEQVTDCKKIEEKKGMKPGKWGESSEVSD